MRRSISLSLLLWCLGSPGVRADDAPARIRSGPITDVERRHWSFLPVVRPDVPRAGDGWALTPIDRFIARRLDERDLPRAPEASRRALLRRVSFDLIGMPPTREEMAAFLADDSPAAFERLVDRLLRSPHYGERQGRHWLDVVRYADTAGETADYPVPLAWRYRNWVIDALNRDQPYDEFIREQIAGDLLAGDEPERYEELVTATGYLAVSRRFGFGVAEHQHLTIQDTIDTTGQAILGLTLGCARCHDHKYDAVTLEDYYGWYGIFASSEYALPGDEKTRKERNFVPSVPPEEATARRAAHARELAELDQEIAALERESKPLREGLGLLGGADPGFELQTLARRPADPWSSHERARVASEAQSPFHNVYRAGTRGLAFPGGADNQHFGREILPPRRPATTRKLSFNLDFRNVDALGGGGAYRFYLGRGPGHSAAAELGASASRFYVKSGGEYRQVAPLVLGQWYNLQLELDLGAKTYSGVLASAEGSVRFEGLDFTTGWDGTIDRFFVDRFGPVGGVSPARQFDNFAIDRRPFLPAGESIEERGHELDPWAPLLDARRLAVGTKDVDGHVGFDAWREPPLPMIGVNRLAEKTLTIPGTVPPGAVVGHPGEREGLGIAWQSPIAGRLRITGRVEDAHDCGDGVLWYLDRLGRGSFEALTEGHSVPGGGQDLAEGASGLGVLELEVTRGEYLQLGILPREHYGCDLTRFELRIEELLAEGATQAPRTWDLARDVRSDFLAANPRPDPYGNAEVWHFFRLPVDRGERHAKTRGASTSLAELAKARERLDRIDRELARLRPARDARRRRRPYELIYGVVEGKPADARIQLRGDPKTPGESTPRRDLELFGSTPVASPATTSGRLDMARWITRPDHPLTARVIVNRVWKQHFGRGLVDTPNDFGVRGARPSHPELLDWLSAELVAKGWSLKALHRLILSSAVYRLSIDPGEANLSPAEELERTRLFGRRSRQRLEAESIRDAMLLVSGELDWTPGTAHPFPDPASWGFSQHAPFYAVYPTRRRSVYLMTQRLQRHPYLALFDGADPNASTAKRSETTTPTQALYLLNSDFVHAQGTAFARRILGQGPGARIAFAFELALGRLPSKAELEDSRDFVARYRASARASGIAAGELEATAWSAFARSLLIRNDFLFVE